MKRALNLVFAVLAVPLAAQQPGMMKHDSAMMGHMQQMEQVMAPMMDAMAFSPGHLLAAKDSLALTAQQVTRLTTLRDAAQRAHDAAAGDAKTHMDAMGQALHAAAPDTATVKAHFQEALAAMGRAHWAMLSAAAQSRALLSDAQRAKVDQWAGRMMQHRMGH